MVVIFVVPLIILVFSFLLKIATGPYWQFPDPSYGYLSSSLSLYRGFTPTFTYQPGTSVEILGAITIFLFNIGHSTSDAVYKVLLDPDFYLNAINTVMVIFVFLTSWWLGAHVYHQTKDKNACLLSGLPVLCFLSLRSYSFYDYVPPVITNVSPEPLLISISSVFNLCLLKLFFAQKKQDEVWIVTALGFICGLGIATRLTFIPFLALPFFVSRGWMKFLFIGVSVVSCVLWTIPIIPSYPWIKNWIIRLLTHVGEYGSGSQGFINLPSYLYNWQVIWDKCWFLILFVWGGMLLCFGQMIKNRNNRAWAFILSTIFCIVIQLAIIAKHYDEHYLVSAINLFSPLFVFLYINTAKDKSQLVKTAVSICILIFIILSLGNAWGYYKRLSGFTKEAVGFNEMIHSKYPGFIFVGVFPMPMSNSEAAFFWGNDRDNRQQDELSNLYPQHLAYFYNNINDYAPYLSGIYSIKKRVWADDLIVSGAHVMFVAPKGYDFSQTPYTVIPLEQGKYAAGYLLVESTEIQAEKLFDASVNLLKAGDYTQAFAFASKSKELHYQPVEKVNYLLNFLYIQMKR